MTGPLLSTAFWSWAESVSATPSASMRTSPFSIPAACAGPPGWSPVTSSAVRKPMRLGSTFTPSERLDSAAGASEGRPEGGSTAATPGTSILTVACWPFWTFSTASSATGPALRSSSVKSSTLVKFCPFAPMITSPFSKPALPAGESASTAVTLSTRRPPALTRSAFRPNFSRIEPRSGAVVAGGWGLGSSAGGGRSSAPRFANASFDGSNQSAEAPSQPPWVRG